MSGHAGSLVKKPCPFSIWIPLVSWILLQFSFQCFSSPTLSCKAVPSQLGSSVWPFVSAISFYRSKLVIVGEGWKCRSSGKISCCPVDPSYPRSLLHFEHLLLLKLALPVQWDFSDHCWLFYMFHILIVFASDQYFLSPFIAWIYTFCCRVAFTLRTWFLCQTLIQDTSSKAEIPELKNNAAVLLRKSVLKH